MGLTSPDFEDWEIEPPVDVDPDQQARGELITILHKTEGTTPMEVCRSLQNHLFYYSAQWKICSLEILERDGYTCQHCGRFVREIVGHRSYLSVHHRTSPFVAPERAFNPDNLLTLCNGCHLNGVHDRPY